MKIKIDIAKIIDGANAAIERDEALIPLVTRAAGERARTEHGAIISDLLAGGFDELRRQNDAGGSGIHFVFGIEHEPKRTSALHAVYFDAAKFDEQTASRWLRDNINGPVSFEAAEDASRKLSKDGGIDKRFRTVDIRQSDIDVDARTVKIAFSSEHPVGRFFGKEILDHSRKSVMLDRLRDGGPFLLNHQAGGGFFGGPDGVIGVIDKASIDKDRVGRAVVRFSRAAGAEEIFQDVIDEIRTKISVGYLVHKQEVEDRDDQGRPTSFRVTSWEPLEVSMVSIPADPTVGVGRELVDDDIHTHEDSNIMAKTTELETRDAGASGAKVAVPDDVANVTLHVTRGATAERERVSEILAVNREFSDFGLGELANEAIGKGLSVDDFRKQVLEKVKGVRLAPVTESPDIGLSAGEVKRYSICRAMLAMADHNWKTAGFERECSVAVEQKLKRAPEGFFIPWDVMNQDRSILVPQNTLSREMLISRLLDKATEGADLVATDLQTGNMIELLRNASVLMAAGARTLSGLTGDIAIPRHSGGASTFWVAESTDVSESTPTFDQVALSPNTVGTFTEISRKLLIQTSLDIESFVRGDIITSIAVELDRVGLIGSGSGAEPTGVANTTGIGDVDHGTNGAVPTWAFAVEFESDVSAANAALGRLAYIMNSVTRGKYKTTEKAASTAEFLWDTRAGGTPVNGYPVWMTNALRSNLTKGTGTALSEMLFGNWADLLIALWTGTDVIVNPFAKDKQGTLRITVLQDADIGVRHPASFSYADEVITV